MSLAGYSLAQAPGGQVLFVPSPESNDPYPPPPPSEVFTAPWTPPSIVRTQAPKGINKAPPQENLDYRFKKPTKATQQHLRDSHVLAVPLVPSSTVSSSGKKKAPAGKSLPSPADSDAEVQYLASTLESYQNAGGRYKETGRQSLQAYFDQHPLGAYRVPVGIELGDAYWNSGFWVKAVDIWEAAWAAGKDIPRHEYEAYDLADTALSRLLSHYARMGRVSRLEELVELASKRVLGREASVALDSATEALWFFKNRAEHNIACAFTAHNAICIPLGHSELVPDVDDEAELRGYLKNGISLRDIAQRSQESGANLRVIKRIDPSAAVPVPSIIHWSFGHYSPLMDRNAAGEVRVADPGMRFQGYISLEAIQQQASGYFLIPASTSLPPGYVLVSDEEAGRYYGRHCSHEAKDTGCNKGKGCGGGAPKGMPVVDISLYRPGFVIRDIPLSYPSPYGDGVELLLTYDSAAPRVTDSTTKTSFGAGWTHGFNRFMKLVGNDVEYVIDGSYFVYTWQLNGSYLKPKGYEHMPELTRLANGSYYLTESDGTRDYFARPNTSPATEYWWTSHVAQDGSQTLLTYTSAGLLQSITDPSSRVITFDYTPLPADGAQTRTNLVRKATDPYLRETLFTYHNSGRLASITDPVGILTTFPDDQTVTSMTTPYGTTSFITTNPGTSRTGYVEVTYPNGDKERVVRNHLPPTQLTNANGTKGSPWIPGGMKIRHWGSTESTQYSDPDGIPPTTISGIPFSPKTYHLDYRNTFHWDREAMHLIAEDIKAGKLPSGSMDYNYATIMNWASDNYSAVGGGNVYPVLSSIKRPGQTRVYYNYPGQTATDGVGTLPDPNKIVQQVENENGTPSWTIQYTNYHSDGRIDLTRDELGRQVAYGYNGLDISSISIAGQAQYTATNFNTRRQPQDITGADGILTHIDYNAKGQPTLITRSKAGLSESARYTYDTAAGRQGNLLTIELSKPSAPGGFITASTFTYDAFNRIRRQTDSTTGYAVEYDYDALDRPTCLTHPDGTTEVTSYRHLDPFAFKDRQGFWSRQFYNSMRQLDATQDPAGRVTRYEWCRCGDLRKIIDPMGKTTSFRRDIAGRVIEKELPDGKLYKMTYQPLSGRLATIAYPADVLASQLTLTRRYYQDGRLATIDHRDPAIADLAWQYDTTFGRLTQSTETTSGIPPRATAYTYAPHGAHGSGQLLTQDGPYPNDKHYHTYDRLSRRVKSHMASETSSSAQITHTQELVLDDLGRLDTLTNGLGTFDYTYTPGDHSARVQSITAPGSALTTSYSYYPIPAFGSTTTPQPDAGHLQTIHHQLSGTTLSRFGYGYDLSGRITTWQKQLGATPADTRSWQNGYNRSSELTSITQTGAVTSSWQYQYDPSGNRLLTTEGAAPTSYWQHNQRNQTTRIGGSGDTLVEGTLDEFATVTVAGQPATISAIPGTTQFTFQRQVPLQEGDNTVPIVATDRNGNANTQNYRITAGPVQAQPAYDANGNTLTTGGLALVPGGSTTAAFEWDSLNRLTAWQEHATPQEGTRRTEWTYNGANLREKQVEKIRQGSTWTILSTRTFIWQDYTLVQERDAAGTTVLADHYPQGERRYPVVPQAAATHLYTADHLGSIREVLDITAAPLVLARYDYSPYGQRTQLDSGNHEAKRGYTGHWEHTTSGLTIAPLRSYSATLGRWFNEDPLGEEGGVNLYAYVLNSPLDRIDMIGLDFTSFIEGIISYPIGNYRSFRNLARNVGLLGEEAKRKAQTENTLFNHALCRFRKDKGFRDTVWNSFGKKFVYDLLKNNAGSFGVGRLGAGIVTTKALTSALGPLGFILGVGLGINAMNGDLRYAIETKVNKLRDIGLSEDEICSVGMTASDFASALGGGVMGR